MNEAPRFDSRAVFFLVSDAIFEMVPVIFWCFVLKLSTFTLCGTFNPLSVLVDTDRVGWPAGLAAHAQIFASLIAFALLGIASVPLRTEQESMVFHEMEVFFLASPLPRWADLNNRTRAHAAPIQHSGLLDQCTNIGFMSYFCTFLLTFLTRGLELCGTLVEVRGQSGSDVPDAVVSLMNGISGGWHQSPVVHRMCAVWTALTIGVHLSHRFSPGFVGAWSGHQR